MKISRRPCWSLIWLSLVLAADAAVAQAPFQLSPQEGLLLLTNGQVLRGKVTPAGDHYFVEVPEGEIRLKTSEVEMFCRDLEEGYRRKRSAIIPGQIQDHLDLAGWCIRHSMIGYAAKELGSAVDLDPRHPKIALLERQLQLAMKPPEEPPTANAATPGVSNDDLDRLVRGMPEGTVDTFTHTIQPLLMNSCTAGGCHGPSSATSFSLLRIPLSRTPNRRLTQRNLHATLQQITSADPSNSPLLLKPILEHGPTKTAIFTNHEMAQYKQLAAWVHRVARSTPPAPEQTAQRPEPLLQKIPPLASPRNERTPQTNAMPTPASIALSASAEAQKSPPPISDKKSAESFVPADAFDAEIFNRRFLPK